MGVLSFPQNLSCHVSKNGQLKSLLAKHNKHHFQTSPEIWHFISPQRTIIIFPKTWFLSSFICIQTIQFLWKISKSFAFTGKKNLQNKVHQMWRDKRVQFFLVTSAWLNVWMSTPTWRKRISSYKKNELFNFHINKYFQTKLPKISNKQKKKVLGD